MFPAEGDIAVLSGGLPELELMIDDVVVDRGPELVDKVTSVSSVMVDDSLFLVESLPRD